MGQTLTYRKPLYQLAPEAQERIKRLSPCSQRTATHVLELVGQWCVDNATDGRVSLCDLRCIHDFADWRRMQRYVSLFVDVGILIDLGQGDYVLEHFDEYHAPAWLQEQRIRDRRAKCCARVRALRDRRSGRKLEKTGTCEPCNADQVDVISVEDSKETNRPARVAELEERPVSSQTEADETDDAFFARLAAMAKREQPEAIAEPARPPTQPSDAPMSPKPKPAMRVRRPARMPKEQRPANEGDVAEAARRLHLGPEYVPELHAELARIRATDADIGYAVRAIHHAPGVVRRPDRYLLGVIREQQRQRLAAVHWKRVGS